MKTDDIELKLYQNFGHTSQLLIPNVSFGFVSWGEIDLLRLTTSDYLHEYEIKISMADFRKEKKKRRWHSEGCLREFTRRIRIYNIAAPADLAKKIADEIQEDRHPFPEGIGVIGFGEQYSDIQTFLEPVANRKAEKIKLFEQCQLGRLLGQRYWKYRGCEIRGILG